MNLGKRPLSILVLSCLHIAIGTIGFAYHFPRPLAFHYEDVWIEGTELLAIRCRSVHAPGSQLGTLARASLDCLPRGDQLSGGSPDRRPFLVSGCDCLASLSISGKAVFREQGKERN
jgi:hypothetical protein